MRTNENRVTTVGPHGDFDTQLQCEDVYAGEDPDEAQLPTLQPGDLVKFKHPTIEEARELFKVLENRGDKVLVQDANGYFDSWVVKPTAVYLVADLEKATQSLKEGAA